MDCRRLISNTIVYWNTRYIAHALETLERLRDDDVRSSPGDPDHALSS